MVNRSTRCLAEYPGGYCTIAHCDDNEVGSCPEGATCYRGNCHRACDRKDPFSCGRSEYVCDPVEAICLPGTPCDPNDPSSCNDPTQHCDPVLSQCVAGRPCAHHTDCGEGRCLDDACTDLLPSTLEAGLMDGFLTTGPEGVRAFVQIDFSSKVLTELDDSKLKLTIELTNPSSPVPEDAKYLPLVDNGVVVVEFSNPNGSLADLSEALPKDPLAYPEGIPCGDSASGTAPVPVGCIMRFTKDFGQWEGNGWRCKYDFALSRGQMGRLDFSMKCQLLQSSGPLEWNGTPVPTMFSGRIAVEEYFWDLDLNSLPDL